MSGLMIQNGKFPLPKGRAFPSLLKKSYNSLKLRKIEETIYKILKIWSITHVRLSKNEKQKIPPSPIKSSLNFPMSFPILFFFYFLTQKCFGFQSGTITKYISRKIWEIEIHTIMMTFLSSVNKTFVNYNTDKVL